MKKTRRIALSLVLAVLLTLGLVAPALAANPTVTITIAAEIVSITNTIDTWAVGAVTSGSVAKYFSADNLQNNTYSQITNAGNVAVLIKIQGTDFIDVGLAYNWTLAASASNKTLSMHANSEAAPTVYDIEVKNAATYSTLIASLAALDTYDWSMKMMTPTDFDPADDGGTKTATVTLVATKA